MGYHRENVHLVTLTCDWPECDAITHYEELDDEQYPLGWLHVPSLNWKRMVIACGKAHAMRLVEIELAGSVSYDASVAIAVDLTST